MLDDYKAQLKIQGKIILRIKVHAGAKQTRVKSILSDGTIKIDLAEVPEAGKANDKLIVFLASEFAIAKNCVTILYGKFSADKTIALKLK